MKETEQTLFLKESKLFIRLKEGEFEVSNPELIGFFESGNFFLKSDEWGTGFLTDPIEWAGKVELIKQRGAINLTVARLLPEDKKDYLFKINPTLSSSNSSTAHSFTESAYKEFQPLSEEQFNSPQNQNRDNAIVGFLKTGLDKIDESGLVLSNDDKARLLNKRIENLSKPVSAPSESQEELWIDVSNVFTVAGHGDAAHNHLLRTYTITRKPE